MYMRAVLLGKKISISLYSFLNLIQLCDTALLGWRSDFSLKCY